MKKLDGDRKQKIMLVFAIGWYQLFARKYIIIVCVQGIDQISTGVRV